MTYIDGFVAAVPTANKQKFIDHAKLFSSVLIDEFGALSVTDCWGNDVPDGEATSFPLAVKKKDDETVCFSWIVWSDKATRDQGMQRMMSDPRFETPEFAIPFDGKRVIFGGFDPVHEA